MMLGRTLASNIEGDEFVQIEKDIGSQFPLLAA